MRNCADTKAPELLLAGGMVRSLIDAADRMPSHELTARQREVLQLLAEGHAMKPVAAVLNAELIQFAIANLIV